MMNVFELERLVGLRLDDGLGELLARPHLLALHAQMESAKHLAVDIDPLLSLSLAAVFAHRAKDAVLLDDARRQDLEVLPVGRWRETQNHEAPRVEA